MEEIEVVSSEKITKHIIENWLPYGAIFHLFYYIILLSIIKKVGITILGVIISVSLQLIAVWLIWKISNEKAFKGRSIHRYDIPEIMKNLTKFTIVVCITCAIFNFLIINEGINAVTNEMKESYSGLKNILGEELYDQQIELIIQPHKNKINRYIMIIQIINTGIYLGMLGFEKKELLNYAVLVE